MILSKKTNDIKYISLFIYFMLLSGINIVHAQKQKGAFYTGVYGKDKSRQQDYAKHIPAFLRSKGINTFEDQFNTDASTPDQILQAGGFKKLHHSLGLVATAASTLMINKDDFDFVHALWNAKLQPYNDGYFDSYYDSFLYMFSLMHLSGKYQFIKPSTK